jgi:hypothetical protein
MMFLAGAIVTGKIRLIAAFQRYGLPLCIMSDNGSP